MDPILPEPITAPDQLFYIAERAPTDEFLIVVGGDSHVLARRWSSRPLHGSPEEGESINGFLFVPFYIYFDFYSLGRT